VPSRPRYKIVGEIGRFDERDNVQVRNTLTDCGVCVVSCPWTKPRILLHRVPAEVATRKNRAGWWMSRAEENGLRFKPQENPSFFEEPDPVWKKYKAFR
jgi:hypothetical protein